MTQGGTQEGVLPKTAGGRTREEVGWSATNRARGPEGAGPGGGGLRRAAASDTEGASADAPGAPTPARQINTGWGGHPAEWAGNLGRLEVFLDLRPMSGFSNYDNLALWAPVQCSEWPIRRAPAEGPSVPRAGWHDRPRGHASPVAGALKPRASRLLVGCL